MADNSNSDDDIEEYLRNDELLVGPSPEFARSLRDRTKNEMRQVIMQHSQSVSPKRSINLLSRAAATILVLLASAGVATIFAFYGLGHQVVFADLQEALLTQKTVSFKESSQQGEKPPQVAQIFISGPNLVRVEQSDGSYSVMDFQLQKTMLVIPSVKTATIMLGVEDLKRIPPSFSLYRKIHGIAEGATERLPERDIDGQRVDGFLVDVGEENDASPVKVWVDSETMLPIRFECNHNGVQRITSNFVFDSDLAPSLFSFAVPEGYELTTHGISELAPVDKDDSNLVVTPLVGIGDITFGMPKERVIATLGIPDKEVKAGKNSQQLEYYSRGFSLFVFDDTRGVLIISAYSQKGLAVQVRDFQGKTDKGIGLGASESEIERAYGRPDSVRESTQKDVYGSDAEKPDEKTGQKTLTYDDLRLSFSLYDGKLYQFSIRKKRE